jgi:hypothetical protein
MLFRCPRCGSRWTEALTTCPRCEASLLPTSEDADRLARAVLLFHKSPPWTVEDRELWTALTGTREATTRTLCDLARAILREPAYSWTGRDGERA